MDEDQAGQQDAHELPGGHDGSEQQSTELLNGVQDDELPQGRTDGQEGHVHQRLRMHGDKLDRLEQLAGSGEAEQADAGGAQVHVEHLVVRLHLVSLKQLVLEGAGESIETKIADHQPDTLKASRFALLRVTATDRTPEREGRTPARDCQRDQILLRSVGFLINKGAPNHHRNHLRTFAERLHREADVLERLVLAGGCNHVGKGHQTVLPPLGHRCGRQLLLVKNNECYGSANQSIVQH
mmetsp:Transcript_889/g.1570  ORF Transcript_889/g.1570 Transcript_889/m.1570 type:complete len:239 (-) Transcript_889:348-1064(-)